MPEKYHFKQFRKEIGELVMGDFQPESTLALLPAPGHVDADFGMQLASLAKEMKKNPEELARDLKDKLNDSEYKYLENTVNTGPYLNFKIDIGKFGADASSQVLAEGKDFGKEKVGKGKKVVIDMSSPNIAKRMSYGHLRSTVIGDSLARLFESQGYGVVKDNHIGDWGTQFGNLIAAIKQWSSLGEIESSDDKIGLLQALYEKFHAESEKQKKGKEKESELEQRGREWFRKLEEGDKQARKIWKKTVDWSLGEFQVLYDALGVDFDEALGESFYEDRLKGVIKEVRSSGIGSESEGALVVNMEEVKDLKTAIVQKSDGASVYMTRDLACAIYREEEMGADKLIYVVGADQKLYFRQLFEILKRMGHPVGENSTHVYFGMVSLEEGKMSTRRGRVILLKDVIDEGYKRAEEQLKERNKEAYDDPKKRKEITQKVAIGALKWNDLSEDERRDITFDWDNALKMEGYSAPYVQYTAVRASSVLDKAKWKGDKVKSFSYDEGDQEKLERRLILKIAEYPDVLANATEELSPSTVARYVHELAQMFNKFYNRHSIRGAESEDIRNSRLALTASTRQVIENALYMLGIEVPSEM